MHSLFLTLPLLLLLLSPAALGSTNTGFTLRLIHRDSIHSPLRPRNLTDTDLRRRLGRYTRARLLRLRSALALDDGTLLNAATPRPIVQQDDWQYYVQLRLGTPETMLHLLLDSGSHLIWTQCHPCTTCFTQDPPHYYPQNSNTFAYVPCNDPLCKDYTCTEGKCKYTLKYSDRSQSTGYLARETLTLESSELGKSVAFQHVAFGCAFETTPQEIFHKATVISGILGMGLDPLSLPVQLGDRIKKRFSYCLVPAAAPTHSYLRFGDDIPTNAGYKTTALLQSNKKRPYYLVNLVAISFNGDRLTLPPDGFSRGCLIDSGAAYTALSSSVYDVVHGAMRSYFGRLNLSKVKGRKYGFEDLELCYLKPDGFDAYPTMSFHFKGTGSVQEVELTLPMKRLFVMDDKGRGFCMGMQSWDSKNSALIGSVQQTDVRFTYDLESNLLMFADESCVND
ncbi:aspartic proteinase nepenthesin-1-like [Typha latifolia]|uniref:aspartic proteinase nepenthesin-1-like n=1 Tax=Typha latifolia TaxID=4733 RepID=UPI003C2C5751